MNYSLRLGRSLPLNGDFRAAVDEVRALGFDSADIDLCTFWTDEEREKRAYRHLEEAFSYFRASGLFLNGVHISFGRRWDFSSTDPAFREAVIRQAAEIFRRVDPFRPNCYVLHGSFEPIPEEERAARLRALACSLEELKKTTETLLCVENLPRTCLMNTSAELCRLTEEIKGIGVCLDVNHFLQEKPEDAVLRLGERIFTTHISDFDFINERHYLPKKGLIDWNRVIENLEKIGYRGVFNYEATGSSAEIRENFDTLFADYAAYKAEKGSSPR